MQDLITTFRSLKTPESEDDIRSFSAAGVDGTSHRVAKNFAGCPVLLIKTSSSTSTPVIRLENLTVEHQVTCKINSQEDSVENGVFTVISCTEADDEVIKYFFRVVDPVLRELGPTPTAAQVAHAISHLVELFRSLAQPAMKSVSGLWAELFLIRSSKNPKSLLRIWHASPTEKYDFSSGDQRIEVKSTSKRTRIHHFSLEQLIPPEGCRVIIASVFVERNGGGTSLGDMVEEILLTLNDEPDLQERLNRVIATTLGDTLREGYTIRFDYELATESLQFFNTSDVPKITEQLPQSISDVHFVSDMNQCVALNQKDLHEIGGIFGLYYKLS